MKKKSVRNIRNLRIAGAALLAFCVGAVVFFYDQTNRIESTRVGVTNVDFPAAFSDFTLAQVSDLHGKRFGKNQKRLLEHLRTARPDVIVLTGDIVDGDTADMDSTREFLTQAAALAPIYYVSGNHDRRAPFCGEYKALLAELGATNLDGQYVTLTRGGETITLGGVGWFGERPEIAPDILLMHSPDGWEALAGKGTGLILCGHKHGGQIALPGKAILAPGEYGFDWNPAYASGRFELDGTTLYVSRGLGTSILPFRMFAQPEIAILTLNAE